MYHPKKNWGKKINVELAGFRISTGEGNRPYCQKASKLCGNERVYLVDVGGGRDKTGSREGTPKRVLTPNRRFGGDG